MFEIYDVEKNLVDKVLSESELPEYLHIGHTVLCSWDIHNPFHMLEISISLGKAKAVIKKCGEEGLSLKVTILSFSTADLLSLSKYIKNMFIKRFE
jgi:hypothetical protein